MPTIEIEGERIECAQGANLRRVLMKARARLYHGAARVIHCRGLGTCGTCAVEVEGAVSEPTAIERWRLSFPPHRAGSGLRLACQCRVEGDLRIRKHAGLWGHRREE
jgi:ferredoxin